MSTWRTALGLCVFALALLAAGSAVGATGADGSFKGCRDIVFTPRTEDGIGQIRVRGASCRLARRVARASESLGIVDGTYEYEKAGFRCTGVLEEMGLPRVEWRCARGEVRIAFVRS